MKPVLRWTISNLTLAVLALILAILTWVVAAEEADPTRIGVYTQGIPIIPTGLSEDMTMVGEVDSLVRVTVRAPESVWQSITADDFSATVDLTGLEEGTHTLPIRVTLREKPSLVTWEPRTLTLELARRAERLVPVRVNLEGEPTVGYLAHPPTATPALIMATGPSTYVTQIVEAAANVSVQNASAGIEDDFALQPLDGAGALVPYVTLTPARVHILVPIALSEDYRTLTVSPVRVGIPASGYTITGFAVDPDTVVVSGPPEIIAAMPGYVETGAVNVEGAQTDVTVHQTLNVPPNVTIVSGQQVTVTFYVEAIQSSLIMEITPTIQGLDPGFTATISPATVEVFLSGPLPQLEALRPDDMRIVIDLLGLPRGAHLIELEDVMAPEGLTVRSILPAAVQVDIRAISSTPTPRSTPGGS